MARETGINDIRIPRPGFRISKKRSITMFKKEKTKGLRYVISGVLTDGEISAKSDEILRKYGEKAKIPGFRPGRVPVDVLRRRFGTGATREAIDSLINDDLEKFAREKNIRLAGDPNATVDKFVPGADAEYSLEFDVMPELPKFDLEKITLTKRELPVGDGDIDAALENVRKSRGEFQKRGADYKLASGDIAVIDYAGFVDGAKFSGGEAKKYSLTLGSGDFSPGFEDQVVGHSAGDEFDVNVKFPDDYRAENLAGKQARFEVKVVEARHPVPPEMNDRLAKDVGFDTVEKLREHIGKILADRNAEDAKTQMRGELLDQLSERVKLELPESLVDAETNAAKEREGKDFDEKKARKDAERRVKLGLILAEWGNVNGVRVGSDELQSAIWADAARYQNPKEVYEYYNKNQDALSMINGMLFERKVLDAMIAKCKFK
jgi:trigger factor